MTQPHDPVEEFLDAYFDYLEGIAEEPSMALLTGEQRDEADQLVASLRAGRGIDPEASRPSVAALLASGRAAPVSTQGTLQRSLENGLRAGHEASVARDAAAEAAGFASSLVVRVGGLRVRVIVEDVEADIDAAYGNRVRDIAALFGAFPDTNAVLLAKAGEVPSGVIVDRDDVVTAIETPSGLPRPPRISRPVTDPVIACADYLAEVMPAFEPFEYVAATQADRLVEMLDFEQIATGVVEDVAAAGGRAQIDAKRAAWSELSALEAAGIAAALQSALMGSFTEDRYRRQVDRLVEVA